MLEQFWLILMKTSVQFLKLHYEFENKLQTLLFEFTHCVHAAERVTGKARWNQSTQNSQWTNACQHCWIWHVRNASYVFPSTNSFLVHHHSLLWIEKKKKSASEVISLWSVNYLTGQSFHLQRHAPCYPWKKKTLLWSPMYSNWRSLIQNT